MAAQALMFLNKLIPKIGKEKKEEVFLWTR